MFVTKAWGLPEFPAKQRGTCQGDASYPGPALEHLEGQDTLL